MTLTKCPHSDCKEPPYTPSGMINFSCLYWKRKERAKNQKIKEDLEKVKEKARKAKKKQFSLDRLINIRDNLALSEIIFDAEKYVLNNTGTITRDTRNTLDQLAVITEQQNSLRMNVQRLTSLNSRLSITVTEVFDNKLDNSGRVSQAIKEGNDIFLKVKPPVHRSNEELHDEIENIKDQFEEKIEYMSSLLNDLISQMFKIEKGKLVDNIKFLADRFRQDEKELDHYDQYSKFLIRVATRKEADTAFFVCNDFMIAKHLAVNHPNSFFLVTNEWKNHPPNDVQYSEHRINIVPSFLFVPNFKINVSYLDFKTTHRDFWTSKQSAIAPKEIKFKQFFELDILKHSTGPGIKMFYSENLFQDREFDPNTPIYLDRDREKRIRDSLTFAAQAKF